MPGSKSRSRPSTPSLGAQVAEQKDPAPKRPKGAGKRVKGVTVASSSHPISDNAGPPKKPVSVHRCRFVDWVPSAVHVAKFSHDGRRLAVARADAGIEIWTQDEGWRLLQRIMGHKDRSVTGLAWCGERLISVGLHGQVTGWDLDKLSPALVEDTYGGAAMCCAVDRTGENLAVGCEDGSVRLFTVNEDGVVYKKALEGQTGHVMSLAWTSDGESLFSGGSESTILRWKVGSGRSSLRISVETRDKQPTIVWCLQALQDGSLASGDSLGHVQVWEGQHGTLLHSFQSHRADVLTLVEDPIRSAIFAAGVDHKVVMFQWVQTNGLETSKAVKRGKWVYSCHRRQHTHDVRTLAITGELLVSGGIDTQLCLYNTNKFDQATKPVYKLMPFPETSCVCISRATRRLLARHAHSLELWQLGTADDATEDAVEGSQMALKRKPSRLLQLQSRGKSIVRCSAMSADTTFIAFADADAAKLFKVEYTASGTVANVEELGSPAGLHSSVMVLTFTSKALLCATVDGRIQVVNLDSNTVMHTLDHRAQGGSPAAICSLAVSADEQWLASGDQANGIHVFNIDTMQHQVRLPAFESAHSALGFHDSLSSSMLVVACWSGHFYHYNVEERALKEYAAPNRNRIPRPRLSGMAFNPASPDITVFFSASFMCSVHMSSAASSGQKSKRSKQTTSSGTDVEEKYVIIDRYRPILHMDFLDPSTLVVVERPWLQVMESFPGTLQRKVYGT